MERRNPPQSSPAGCPRRAALTPPSAASHSHPPSLLCPPCNAPLCPLRFCAPLVLQPDCTNSITTPVCFKSAHNIGYVRLGVYTIVPMLVAVLLATIVGFITQRHQIMDLDRGRKKLTEQAQHIRQVASLVRERSNELRIARHREVCGKRHRKQPGIASRQT